MFYFVFCLYKECAQKLTKVKKIEITKYLKLTIDEICVV